MLEKTFGLFFYLKQAKNQKDGLRYVYLRITVDGKPVEMSTKQLWSPARWNVDAGRAIGQKEDTRTLNAYLDMLSSKVFQAKKMLIEDDKELSAEALKNVLLGKSNETRTILEVFQRHNEQMEALVGQEFSAHFETLQDREGAYRLLHQVEIQERRHGDQRLEF